VATAIEEVRSSLQGTFHGDLLGPADPAYANARVIWNGMVARSPGLIARCADVADVQAAVRAGATTSAAGSISCADCREKSSHPWARIVRLVATDRV
jgi:hypothetical protein